MAIKKPLVTYSGQLAEIAAGDDLDVSATSIEKTVTNGEASPIVIGTPVYISSTADEVLESNAGAAATQVVDGLVSDTSIAAAATGGMIVAGTLTATTGQWDAVTGQVGGLTPGAQYWLDIADGMLTTTVPTGAGEYQRRVGRALSTTDMCVGVKQSILLA